MAPDSASYPGSPDSLPTAFAPAERATYAQLQTQIDYIENIESFWQLIDSIPDMLMVLNAQRQVVFANQALFEALDLEPTEAIGQRPGEMLSCIHAHAMPGGCGTSEFCRTCGAGRAIVSSLAGKQSTQECRITQQDGSALDLRVWARPLHVGGELFSVFTVSDIRHEKRRHALESIFFHDVLNLAGVLLGYSELLETASDDQEVQRIQGTLVRTSARLVEEIKAQRDLLAAETGELHVDPVPLSVLELLHSVVDDYAGHDVANQRHLVIADDTPDAVIESDRTLLMRVLGNMTKNALEASEPGQTVTVSSALDGDSVSLRVHNPSVMPHEVQLQVFRRSFSTRGPGRGLGTYSMKLLSERYLHGRVTFTSRPGEGTCFVASYPLEFPSFPL